MSTHWHSPSAAPSAHALFRALTPSAEGVAVEADALRALSDARRTFADVPERRQGPFLYPSSPTGRGSDVCVLFGSLRPFRKLPRSAPRGRGVRLAHAGPCRRGMPLLCRVLHASAVARGDSVPEVCACWRLGPVPTSVDSHFGMVPLRHGPTSACSHFGMFPVQPGLFPLNPIPTCGPISHLVRLPPNPARKGCRCCGSAPQAWARPFTSGDRCRVPKTSV